MFANWARTKNDVASRSAKMTRMATIVTIAMIAETEIVRFLKTFKIWVFFEKIDALFEKNLNFFQNS